MNTRQGFSPAWNKFRIAFNSELLKAGQMVTKEAEKKLLATSDAWLKKTDDDWPKSASLWYGSGGDDMHPWYSGTLHDSISIRIAEGMRTIGMRFMPTRAIADQTATAEQAGRDLDNIVGYKEGRLVAGRATGVRANALVAQMFIGAPYAQWLNTTGGPYGNHQGFALYLMKDFQYDIEHAMAALGQKAYRVE